jgi:hypothetical protein
MKAVQSAEGALPRMARISSYCFSQSLPPSLYRDKGLGKEARSSQGRGTLCGERQDRNGRA